MQRVERYPHELLKGLIESDGYRITNFAIARGKRYEYPRYFFTNHSVDIQVRRTVRITPRRYER